MLLPEQPTDNDFAALGLLLRGRVYFDQEDGKLLVSFYLDGFDHFRIEVVPVNNPGFAGGVLAEFLEDWGGTLRTLVQAGQGHYRSFGRRVPEYVPPAEPMSLGEIAERAVAAAVGRTIRNGEFAVRVLEAG
jgi:hypothetical protein